MKSFGKALHFALVSALTAALAGCGDGRSAAPPPPNAQAPTAPAPATPEPATQPAATATPAPAIAPEPPRIEATADAVASAEKVLADNADRSRRMRAALSFDDFKATVYREPFEGGKFIVNGDTPIANEKLLLEFYEKNVKPPQPTRLIIDQASGMDNKWNPEQQKRISYCVSTTFAGRHDNVVREMDSATRAWEEVAAIDFVYDGSQDATCTPANAAVAFDVRPVDAGGEYLARAFFPNEGRPARNVLIDESAFDLRPGEKLTLTGILRHELGHSIGFRHEHTRPESGTCFEDRNWSPLTSYDAFSVMHYPQCNGRGDWSLTLTPRDKNGAACVYGAAAGFTVDTSLTSRMDCASAASGPAGPAGENQVKAFPGERVDKSAIRRYGPFRAAAGSIFEANMVGAGASGDPDLYLRFGRRPDVNGYDCRPFADGPVETCALAVPAGSEEVFLMVRGYSQAVYDLELKFVAAPTP